MKTQLIDSFEALVLHQETQRIQNTNTPNIPTRKGNGCTVVEYSPKAIAVFGETRAIKNELKVMGGKFNARLTMNGEKLAGWIFSKSQEKRLACYFGLD